MNSLKASFKSAHAFDVLIAPLTTEKSIRIMESENKLIFTVAKKATRNEVKTAIEQAFKVKVLRVNTMITPQGIKKAYITLSKETPAIDVASQLGIM